MLKNRGKPGHPAPVTSVPEAASPAGETTTTQPISEDTSTDDTVVNVQSPDETETVAATAEDALTPEQKVQRCVRNTTHTAIDSTVP